MLFSFNCFNVSVLLYEHFFCCSNGYIGFCSLQHHTCVLLLLLIGLSYLLPFSLVPCLFYGHGPQFHPYLIRSPTLIWFAVFICVCLTTQDKYFGSLGSLRFAPYMMCPLMSFPCFSLEFHVLPAHPHQSEFLVYVDSNSKALYIAIFFP